MLKNHKIRTKLILCFGALFAILLGVGGISLQQMSKGSASVQELGIDRRAKLEAAAEINTALSDFRLAEANHLLTSDPAIKARHARENAALRKLIEDRIAYLDPRVNVAAVRKRLDDLKQTWPKYLASSGQVIALSDAGQTEAALSAFHNTQALFDEANGDAMSIQKLQSDIMNDHAATAMASLSVGTMMVYGAIGIAASLVLAMQLLLTRLIAHPIAAAVGTLTSLSAGDRDVAISSDSRRDEVGELLRAMASLRDQLRQSDSATQEQGQMIVESVGHALRTMADGDLTSSIRSDLTGMFATLKTDFNRAVEALAGTMRGVAESSSRISTGADEIREASDDLSSRTAQQAASLEETAAAMAQINTSVQQAASGAARALEVVEAARGDADTSGEVVGRTIQAMSDIQRVSDEISNIIGLIDGIAFQTNLLALNAGVEAARAGEAGRGFAVVASEVRALAQRSADAANEVKTRISSSRQQVAIGVSLVNETGASLERIIERIGGINELVADIAMTAGSQASAVAQVNTAISGMEQVTQQNAAMVEESTAAARSLADEAVHMAQAVSRFRLGAGAPRTATAMRPPVVLHSVASSSAPLPVPGGHARMQGNAAIADEEDWTEF